MKTINRFKTLFYRLLAANYSRSFMRDTEEYSLHNICIFMLHGLHDKSMALSANPPRSSTSVDAFKTNLSFLMKHFKIIPLDEAVEMMKGTRNWRQQCVVLTFDDSLKSMATIAAPLLADLGLTATFYLSTETIETRKPYWWVRLEQALKNTRKSDISVEVAPGKTVRLGSQCPQQNLPLLKSYLKSISPDALEAAVQTIEEELDSGILTSNVSNPFAEPLSWEDVHQLINLGMTVGCHTRTHPNLTLLNPTDLHQELSESRKTLETVCGKPVQHLCYPYGSYSSTVISAASNCGYISGMTTREPGWNPKGSDTFQQKRFNMPSEPYKIAYTLSNLSS